MDQYFISKGILVIVATHSPTTISLAPATASFYEVFKPNSTSADRILPVYQDDYAELKIANKTFYTKISDQTSRISELEQEKAGLEKSVSELQQQTKASLFVEGKIDVQYLNKAAEFYPEWKEILDCVELKEKKGAGNLDKYWKNRSEIKEFSKFAVILLYDCDTNKKDEDDASFYKRCIPIKDESSIKHGIENLFNDGLILKAETSMNKRLVKKNIFDSEGSCEKNWELIKDEKKNLADWICANAEKNDFEAFGVIFDLIKSILDKN